VLAEVLPDRMDLQAPLRDQPVLTVRPEEPECIPAVQEAPAALAVRGAAARITAARADPEAP
jgi:hypothetical protein